MGRLVSSGPGFDIDCEQLVFHGEHFGIAEREKFASARAVDVTAELPGAPKSEQVVEANTAASHRPERTVLVIASRFPPVASVGAIRVRKFVKYLRVHGWRPVVVTGAMRRGPVNSHDARRATDLESLRDIPADVEVHRLGEAMDNWPTYLSRNISTRLGTITSRLGFDAQRLNGLLAWRLQKFHDRLSFPDRGIWRLVPALRAAIALHRRHSFDAVFTTGMPFSDHLIGLALHTLLRRPWLVDFRDPWVEYIHWQQWESAWGQRLTRAAEAAVVHRAACVISVNDDMTERFRSRYSARLSRKFVTIPNGFDPVDFPAQTAPTARAEFRLLYAGSLYKTRSPATMLDAFRRFVEQTPGSASRVRFEFAGRPGPFVAALSHANDGGRVTYVGMLAHGEALRRMAEADVNVILLPNLPGGTNDTTAKVYECLGSGRPILAAVPRNGAAAKTLRGFDGVWLCDPEDADDIANAMCDLYRCWVAGDLSSRRPDHLLNDMTRQRQTQRLAECLNSAVETHGPR